MGDIADDARDEYNMTLTLSVMGIIEQTPEGIDSNLWQAWISLHERELKSKIIEVIESIQKYKKEHPIKYFFHKKKNKIKRFLKKMKSNFHYWTLKKKVDFHKSKSQRGKS